MSKAELAEFLDAQRTVTCATLGPAGRPHLASLWYVPVGGRLDCWTHAASQKARNLERGPPATLMIEIGCAYQELRGVSMECDAELVHDSDQVLDIGVALAVRHGGSTRPPSSAPPCHPRRPTGRHQVHPTPDLDLGPPQARLGSPSDRGSETGAGVRTWSGTASNISLPTCT